MFKQGRVIIIIGTMLTVIASFFVPSDIINKFINALVALFFGILAMGSSFLAERAYNKMHNKKKKKGA